MGTWKGEEASPRLGRRAEPEADSRQPWEHFTLLKNELSKKGQLVNEMHRPVNSLTGIVKHVPLLREEATHQVGGWF